MDSEMVWWRRPRLLMAALCAGLGVAVLAAGPFVRPGARQAPAEPAELGLDGGLGELDGDLAAGLDAAPADEAEGPPAPAELVVYVSGAVVAPDVYRVPAGARVKDAVLAAGGLAAEADGSAVNLAAPLSDAQHVHIPPVGAGPPAAPEAPAAGGPGGQIDLNRAGAAELEDLPGIGKTLAERILAYRESNGPFTSVEGLREVQGVGDKLYEQIAPMVMVGG